MVLCSRFTNDWETERKVPYLSLIGLSICKISWQIYYVACGRQNLNPASILHNYNNNIRYCTINVSDSSRY